MLARVDAALARERRLLSDASHELRTPLTVLRTAPGRPARVSDADELRAALESAGTKRDGSGASPRTCWSWLARIRGGCRFGASRWTPASSWMPQCACTAGGGGRRPGAARAGVTLPGPRCSPTATGGQALDNLIANALAHGRGEVRLVARGGGRARRAARDRRRARLPGAPPGTCVRALSQGEEGHWREGSGLGLGIVAAIARAHGGDVGARNSSGRRGRRLDHAACGLPPPAVSPRRDLPVYGSRNRAGTNASAVKATAHRMCARTPWRGRRCHPSRDLQPGAGAGPRRGDPSWSCRHSLRLPAEAAGRDGDPPRPHSASTAAMPAASEPPPRAGCRPR